MSYLARAEGLVNSISAKNWPCVISFPSGEVGKYGYTIKQRKNSIILAQNWPGINSMVIAMTGYSTIPPKKLQNCSHTITWFSVIYRTLFGGGYYPPAEMQLAVSLALCIVVVMVGLILFSFNTLCTPTYFKIQPLRI